MPIWNRSLAHVRVVAVADTHLNHARVRIPDGDVFIHAGDLTAFGSASQLGEVAAWIADLPHPHKIIVAGNHDEGLEEQIDGRRLFAESGATYLCNEEVTACGLRIWGAPWTPTFGLWHFMRARGSEIAAEWAKIPDGLDLLVTHGPAHGCGDLVAGEHVGCVDLARAIAHTRPRWHLCGHIHEDRGIFGSHNGVTTHVNVSTADGRHPATLLHVSLRHPLT